MARPSAAVSVLLVVGGLARAGALRAPSVQDADAAKDSEEGSADDHEAYTDFGMSHHDIFGAYRGSTGASAGSGHMPPMRSVGGIAPWKMLFFTHHKTGTILVRHLAQSMQYVMGMDTKIHIEGRRIHACNFTSRVAHYQNMHEDDLEAIQSGCPRYRAVHMIRSPLSLLASSYLYHSRSNDIFGMPTGPKMLANISLQDGLRIEAKAILYPVKGRRGVLREMAAVHELVKDDPNVLETDLSAFEADFNGATKRVFQHLLGPDHPVIDMLVQVNERADVSRWSADRLAKSDHIPGREQKDAILAAISSLLSQGDPAIVEVDSYSGPLGYSRPESLAAASLSAGRAPAAIPREWAA